MKSTEKPIVTQALLYWSGAGSRTRVYYGANAVQPAFGNASPNHCIQMGSSPAQNIMTGIPRWDIPVIVINTHFRYYFSSYFCSHKQKKRKCFVRKFRQ